MLPDHSGLDSLRSRLPGKCRRDRCEKPLDQRSPALSDRSPQAC